LSLRYERTALKETAYNLFVYVEKSLVKTLGIAIHELDGSDAEKVSTLQTLVNQDYKTARRITVKSKLSGASMKASCG
jgi:hypothetical protein